MTVKNSIKGFACGTVVCLSIIFFPACSNSDSNGAFSELIDYDLLPELEYHLDMEAGSSDTFIPGQLVDLVLISDGTIIVGDRQQRTVEQFSSSGVHQGRIMGSGGGPGETRSGNISLIKGNFDTLIVNSLPNSMQYDYFGRNEEGMYRYIRSSVPSQAPERFIVLLGALSDSEYLARITRVNPITVVVVDPFNNILSDSLHFLESTQSFLMQVNGGMFVFDGSPYQYNDQLEVIGDGRYLVAYPDSSTLFVYNSNHELDRSIPLDIVPRPLESSDPDSIERANLETFEIALENAANEEIRNRIDSITPEFRPPFIDLWVSETHIWMKTDELEKGNEIVVLTMDGEFVGKFYLSRQHTIHAIHENRFYTIHRSPEIGDTIRIYEVKLVH